MSRTGVASFCAELTALKLRTETEYPIGPHDGGQVGKVDAVSAIGLNYVFDFINYEGRIAHHIAGGPLVGLEQKVH